MLTARKTGERRGESGAVAPPAPSARSVLALAAPAPPPNGMPETDGERSIRHYAAMFGAGDEGGMPDG